MSGVLPWVTLALQLAILAVMLVICYYAREASRDASRSQQEASRAATRAEELVMEQSEIAQRIGTYQAAADQWRPGNPFPERDDTPGEVSR